jgi:hypothetical protein
MSRCLAAPKNTAALAIENVSQAAELAVAGQTLAVPVFIE